MQPWDGDSGERRLTDSHLVPRKKLKSDGLQCLGSSEKKPLCSEPGGKCVESEGSAFSSPSAGNPGPDEWVDGPQTFSAHSPLASTSEPGSAQNEPPWNESQLPWETPPEQSGQGFPNMGNTCYMNAILQSLFAVPSFAQDLTQQGIPWEMSPAGAFSLRLSQLLVFKDLCDAQTKAEFLVDIQKSISLVSDIYSSNRQNDAQEFLGHCLSQLKEDMAKLKSTGQRVRKTAGAHSLEPQVLAAQAAPRDCACPVRANFEVELQHSIVCQACGAVVCNTEPNNYLSISLPQAHPGAWSLQDSLDFFFRPEELEYKCGNCKYGRSVVIHEVSRLPRVLIVHLKRYTLSASESLVKDKQAVGIPKYLSLSPHCKDDAKVPLILDSHAHAEEHQHLNVSQDRISGATNSSGGCEKYMENKFSGGSQRAVELLQPADRMRHYEDFQPSRPKDLGQAEVCPQLLPQSLNKADTGNTQRRSQ
ncbi:ubiquitin carboxyl-terminal hydrolase 29-like [Tenrec ecaudatus]|uniref:ubiquitin carboxyl-terminal hydrolase 29-like n=1 Tax=Tenrec ecaudatus TaxID=94439 RepID=UPI003F5A7665